MNDNQTEQRVQGLLDSPLGCLFLLEADALGLTPQLASQPNICFPRAARDIGILDRNIQDNPAVVAEVLERGRSLGPLARSILEYPGSSWWFASIDLDHQVWLADEHIPPDTANWTRPNSPPNGWERSAQIPVGFQLTSTGYGGVVSLLVSNDHGAGDMGWRLPLECWELRVLSDVKVFEVHGAEDWHQLCLRYPARGRDNAGQDEDRLVPDWGAAALDWDGVHLSFGGLLSCEQRRYERDGQWSMHENWHAETTYWLNNIETKSTQLPDHHRTPGPHWLMQTGLRIEGMHASLRPDSTNRGDDSSTAYLRTSDG